MDIIHLTINFLESLYGWFFSNVFPGIITFTKAFLNLVIAIFGFLIDILRWITGRI